MNTDPRGVAMLINGRPGDSIDALDRGLHYGDGLFETLAVVDAEPQLWDRHMRRLSAGCDRLRLPRPDTEALRADAGRLCSGQTRAVLKILVTRGPGSRGYRIEHADPAIESARMTRVLALFPAPGYPVDYYRQGVAVRLCATRLGENAVLAGIKHLSRLEQVLARAEWDDANIVEGLMLDHRGDVIEGTMSNVFAVHGKRLLTPLVSNCGVAGVMREVVLDYARTAAITVLETRISPDVLKASREVFLCNSLIGIWPVSRIDEVALEVGPLARRMTEAVSRYSLMP